MLLARFFQTNVLVVQLLSLRNNLSADRQGFKTSQNYQNFALVALEARPTGGGEFCSLTAMVKTRSSVVERQNRPFVLTETFVQSIVRLNSSYLVLLRCSKALLISRKNSIQVKNAMEMELNYKQLSTAGEPLLILHGLFGSLDNWMTLGRRWSGHFQVFLIDQRNHGRSPHTDTHSYPAMAEDLAAFVQEHQLENVNLLGHSMGGKTIMEYATRHPDTIGKIVVVDIAPKAYPVHHAEIAEAMQQLDVGSLKSRTEADRQLAERLEDPGVRMFLLKNLYRKSDKTFGWRMNLSVLAESLEVIGQPVRSEQSIDVPACFVRGTDSHYVQPDDLPAIRELFPQAELHSLNAGHWVHAQQPDALFELVNRFLQ